MDATSRAALWGQFGAAIEMLENAMRSCPEELWGDRTRQPEFWYVAYHTLFFLDFYLADAAEDLYRLRPSHSASSISKASCRIGSIRKKNYSRFWSTVGRRRERASRR